jgi:hypothetical protein
LEKRTAIEIAGLNRQGTESLFSKLYLFKFKNASLEKKFISKIKIVELFFY